MMSLGGSSSSDTAAAYAFPACAAAQPHPEEFQPNAGPPVTVPAPQHAPSSHVFTCQYCAKQFNARWMLERHSVSHTGAQPYGCRTDILLLKHARSILRQSSNPVCGFSMMEQVRLCAVLPTENWLGSSLNHIQGYWMTV